MTIEKLKQDIENKDLNGPYILICKDNSIIDHYIKYLKSYKDIYFIDKAKLVRLYNSFCLDENSVFIFKDKKLEELNKNILDLKNLLVITSEINKELEKEFKDNIVYINKLEDWQIEDYVNTVTKSKIDKQYINKFISKYKNDFTKLDIELDKLRYINSEEFTFNIVNNNALNIEESLTIFNCINSLIKKDIDNIKEIYKFLLKEDYFSFITLLITNIKNILKVISNKNPTEEHTGLSSKQIYAIKKQYANISINRLINVYINLVNLYKDIRLGYIDNNFILDLIIYICYE